MWGSDRLRAGCQEVGKCSTRGKSWGLYITFTSAKIANKAEPTLALKPRGDVTRNPKQGYQWPQNGHVSAKNFKKKSYKCVFVCQLKKKKCFCNQTEDDRWLCFLYCAVFIKTFTFLKLNCSKLFKILFGYNIKRIEMCPLFDWCPWKQHLLVFSCVYILHKRNSFPSSWSWNVVAVHKARQTHLKRNFSSEKMKYIMSTNQIFLNFLLRGRV